MTVGAPFASTDQLGAYMKTTFAEGDPAATLYLTIASDMIRSYLRQQIDQVINDVVVLDPIDGAQVFLPELPVAAVTLVETTTDGVTWTTADPTTYTVSVRTGLITARPYSGSVWPTDPGSWRVTYTHGYQAIPNTIVGVCLGVAARGYASEPGIESERFASAYQVKYATTAATGFDPLEVLALNSFTIPVM